MEEEVRLALDYKDGVFIHKYLDSEKQRHYNSKSYMYHLNWVRRIIYSGKYRIFVSDDYLTKVLGL